METVIRVYYADLGWRDLPPSWWPLLEMFDAQGLLLLLRRKMH